MAKVFGARSDKETQLSAEHLGIAMQITNILRDVREDYLEKDRVYLPKDMCQSYRVDVSTLLEKLRHKDIETETRTSTPEFSELVQKMASWGIAYYQSALSGVRSIPSFRARICVKAMASIYSAILAQICKNPTNVLFVRISTSKWQKASLSLQVILGRNPLRAAGFKKRALKSAGVTLGPQIQDVSGLTRVATLPSASP
jgi:phytoene synthase